MRNLFGGDPYFNNVVLQLPLHSHLRDESKTAKAVTVNGNTTVVNDAAYFDGNGDYLSFADSADWELDAGDFTIEMWVYPVSGAPTAFQGLISHEDQTTDLGWLLITDNDNADKLTLTLRNGGSTYAVSGNALTGGVWQHIAATRRNGVVRLFQNGVKTGEDTIALTVTNNTQSLRIGALYSNSLPWGYFYGYIKDLRITNGIARYVSNFTPPASLPTHGVPALSRFVRFATIPEAKRGVVLRGNTTRERFNTEYDILRLNFTDNLNDSSRYTTAYSSVVNSPTIVTNGALPFAKSLQLDSGDYIYYPTSTLWGNIYGRPFIIQGWIYPTGAASPWSTIFSCLHSSSQTGYRLLINTSGDLTLSAYQSPGWYLSGVIAFNKWTHFALSWRDGISKAYINGKLVQQAIGQTANKLTVQASGNQFAVGVNEGATWLWGGGYMRDLSITVDSTELRYSAQTAAVLRRSIPTPMLADAARPPILRRRTEFGGDPHFNNVLLQLPLRSHMRDESKLQRAVTQVGDIVVNNESAYFDGTDNTLSLADSADWDFVNNDFTIEFEGYALTRGNTTDPMIVGQAADFSGATHAWAVSCNNTGSVYMLAGAGTGTWGVLSGCAMAVGANESKWQHYAFVRKGSWVGAFCNGRLIDDATWSGTVSVAQDLRIGSTTNYSNLTILSGRLRNMRLTRGARYTSSGFIPPASLPTHGVDNSKIKVVHTGTVVVVPETGKKIVYLSARDNLKIYKDEHFDKVKLLVPFETNLYTNPTGVALQISNTIHTTNPSISATKLYGMGSCYYNNDSEWLYGQINESIGTKDFTIEGWYKINTASDNRGFFRIYNSNTLGTGLGGISAQFLSNGYQLGINGTQYVLGGTTNTNWNHIALTRKGSSLRFFVNGIQIGSTQSNSTDFSGYNYVHIGIYWDMSSFYGNIKDFRVTVGHARYYQNFIKPELKLFPYLK